MKDTYFKVRCSTDEKEQFNYDAAAEHFDDLSAYVLNLLRKSTARIAKREFSEAAK